MNCPNCQEPTKVSDSRSTRATTPPNGVPKEALLNIDEEFGGQWVLRRRICKICKKRFHTLETIVDPRRWACGG